MILTDDVVITLHSKTIKHYKNLGYKIPTVKDNWGRFVVPKKTKILIKVLDLLPKSNVKIECQCEQCNETRFLRYCDYSAICKKCNNINQTSLLILSMVGRKHSKQTKIKMSQSQQKVNRIGDKSPFWNPNLTNEERKIKHNIAGIGKWKRLVKERDNYTCQCCGSNEYLCVHHLDNFHQFIKVRININNGITLCKDCHKLLHKIYGNLTTKEQYNQFIWEY